MNPVVYKKAINDSNGYDLGTVKVFEFEEVVDSVVHFLTETNVELDYITLKNYFSKNVCGPPRVKCTINSAYVFDQIMAR